MTYQEILEGITRHRANPVPSFNSTDPLMNSFLQELRRKLDEIEWALQALAEKGRDSENVK